MSKKRLQNLKTIVEGYTEEYPDKKVGIETVAVFYRNKAIYSVNVFKKWLDEYIKSGDLPKTINKIT